MTILKRFEENNLVFSSANSINIGRLAPQIVYYFYAYAKMVKYGTIKMGEKIERNNRASEANIKKKI